MKTTNKKPILEKEINFLNSKGKYTFYCKNIAILFLKVFSILNNLTNYITTQVNNLFLVSCLWVVYHTSNKLEGICSISSSVCDNLFCIARQKIKDCICKYCYAYNQQSYQHGTREHNILNGLILRNILIPVSCFKYLKILFPYIRIESFGDVQNVLQARNYIRIIKAFPEKRCAIWSKNIEIWRKAFEIEGKPKNTTFVFSSSFLNKPETIDRKKYKFVDHVFTVFDKKYAKENNIVINCGGKKCLECILNGKACYFRNTEFYINELKK